MYKSLHKILISTLLAALFLMPELLFAQGMHTEFGKNRVQYRNYEWSYLRTDRFDVYYYQGGRELAQYVSREAEKHINDIEQKLEYTSTERLVFLVFNKLTEIRESNVGRVETSMSSNTGGITPFVGNMAFVHFDGNHLNFDNEIKRAAAEIIITEMLYGGSFQERLQNATLLNIPDWYIDGIINFIAYDWTSEQHDHLKNGILSDKYQRFHRLSQYEKTIAGQSIWKYIHDVYGSSAMANILYMTRINKNIESSLIFVLGKNFNELIKEWKFYYKNLFNEHSDGFTYPQNEIEIKKRFFRKSIPTTVSSSYLDEYIAFATNDKGKVKIWIYDLKSQKYKRVLKYGYRSAEFTEDHGYPLLGWHPGRNQLTVIFEKKSSPEFFIYDIENETKENEHTIANLERIISFDYHDNGRIIAISAIRNGQTNIFTYDVVTKALRPITNDHYNDLHPKFVRNSSGILFSSNRIESNISGRTNIRTLEFNNSFNIFYYNYQDRFSQLNRITNTVFNEFYPTEYDSLHFGYLTEENGVFNRNAAFLDSIFLHIKVIVNYLDTSINHNDTLYFYENNINAIRINSSILNDTNFAGLDTSFVYEDIVFTYPLTDHASNISDYEVNQNTNKVLELTRKNSVYRITLNPYPTDIPSNAIDRKQDPSRTFKADTIPTTDLEEIESTVKDKDKTEIILDTNEKDKRFLQSEFLFDIEPDSVLKYIDHKKAEKTTEKEIEIFTPPGSRIYYVSFRPDYLVTQFDNSTINSPYIPYNPGENFIQSSQINGMFKLGIRDLLNDYRITGGFKLASNLRGADYFLTYENRRKRLNKQITFFRQSMLHNQVNNTYRTTSHEPRFHLSWPFNETSSIKGQIFYRLDKTTFLSVNRELLQKPDNVSNRIGSKLEYVFDNTIYKELNLLNGTRYKVFAEVFNQIGEEKTLFTVIGFDFRNYLPIYKNIIWANRATANTSIGNAHVVYFLGGVDNWLFPKFNEEIQVDPRTNYVYKSSATNLRGFRQNIRNGNSYALINSEIRIPIIQTLYKRPMKSDFFKNFQIIGFGDIGTAWTGSSPFSDENAFNRRLVVSGPFTISVINVRNPIVYGYGFGMRSSLLGYFVRFDYAWGFEENSLHGNAAYLSLGMDF